MKQESTSYTRLMEKRIAGLESEVRLAGEGYERQGMMLIAQVKRITELEKQVSDLLESDGRYYKLTGEWAAKNAKLSERVEKLTKERDHYHEFTSFVSNIGDAWENTALQSIADDYIEGREVSAVQGWKARQVDHGAGNASPQSGDSRGGDSGLSDDPPGPSSPTAQDVTQNPPSNTASDITACVSERSHEA